MSGIDLNLAVPIRNAILANAAIASSLGLYEGDPAIFTRRPTPESVTYPIIQISPDISIGDMDFLTARLPIVRRDISVFGEQPGDYRLIENIGYLLRLQFHRQPRAIDLSPNYSVIDIRVTGPMSAPTDDDRLVGRACLCTFRLRDLAT